MPETIVDAGAVYADGRVRLTDLLRAEEDLEAAGRTPVPACPGWTVADVVAHLTGVCADVLAGTMDGVTTTAWTEAQVSARRPRALTDVLAEWSDVGPRVEALAGRFGTAGTQWVFDLATHEHDVRGALGAPGARESDAVSVGLGFLVPAFLQAVVDAGRPPLEVRAGGRGWRSSEAPVAGDPAATLTAEPFDVLRSLSGRRSVEQVRALPWDGDPAPYLPVLAWGPFTPPVEPLVE